MELELDLWRLGCLAASGLSHETGDLAARDERVQRWLLRLAFLAAAAPDALRGALAGRSLAALGRLLGGSDGPCAGLAPAPVPELPALAEPLRAAAAGLLAGPGLDEGAPARLGALRSRLLARVPSLAGSGPSLRPAPGLRRSAGSFYTPDHVAKFMSEETVAALRSGGCDAPRVLDPACGAGSLLVAAARALFAGRRISLLERARLLGRLHGLDTDPLAVEAARLALALAAVGAGPRDDLPAGLAGAAQITEGDALVEPGPDAPAGARAFAWGPPFDRRFDAVLANPPFCDAERMTREQPALRRYCAGRYVCAAGNWDLFAVFIERAVGRCAPGGRVGLVVPNRLASATYARPARELLAAQRVVCLRDYSGVPVFGGAAVYPLVVVAEVGGADAEGEVRVERVGTGPNRQVRVEGTQCLPRTALRTGTWPLAAEAAGVLARLRADPERYPPLGEVAEVCGAATVAEAYAIAGLLREGGDGLRLVNSGTVDRFCERWGERACRYLGRSYLRPVVPSAHWDLLPPKRLREATRPKLIVAGMTRALECAFDPAGGVLAGKSTAVIFSAGCDLRYLLALLNSRPVTGLFAQMFAGERLARGYLKVGPPQLRALPVRRLDLGQPAEAALHARALALADDLRTGHAAGASGAALARAEAELDGLVAALYDLTPAEFDLLAAAARRGGDPA